MIRIQIGLDENEYALAKAEAKALGISVAELFQRAIRQILPTPGNRPWMRYAGLVESSDVRSSLRIDDIVCGAKY